MYIKGYELSLIIGEGAVAPLPPPPPPPGFLLHCGYYHSYIDHNVVSGLAAERYDLWWLWFAQA